MQHVLLIENEPQTGNAVRNALADSKDGAFAVNWVRTCAEGLEVLTRVAAEERTSSNGIAGILVDPFVGDDQGIETFDRLSHAAPHTPILILCATEQEDAARLVVHRGAQDFLLKTRIHSHRLPKLLRSMFERAAIAETLFEERERAQITLDSIGDAVVSSDVSGAVTDLNPAAEAMTGWSRLEASGHPVEDVLQLVDALTRQPLPNPLASAIQTNKRVFIKPNCLLIRRDGVETEIGDSAVPVHDRRGRVIGAVMVFRDASAARALSLKVSYLAYHDSVTDLPNRTILSDRLVLAVALAQRHAHQLALMFVGLDQFKNINDSLGHSIGDRLLRSVATRLQGCVRSSDTVSRLGGDEFVILFPELTHTEDAVLCADKVMLALNAPHYIDEHRLDVTASIGIVAYPNDGMDADTLTKHGDAAMRCAKERGRNNYQVFEPSMSVRTEGRQSLESDLRHAIDRQELVLQYQPIVNLVTGAISGAEALVRWQHPIRGLVGPNEFVPIAEKSGFIVAIGQWVLREACRQTREWQDAGHAPMRIAINISSVELRQRSFLANLREILTETGLPARFVEIELTETFLMHDSKSTAVVMAVLKEMGVSLALDDFGTGYSSLSHLRLFPIDTLKIDRAFVSGLTTAEDDACIVCAVIRMAKTLKIRAVAEGIETREQLEYLQGEGCPEGQGFYLSPPVPPKEFAQLLAFSTADTAWLQWSTVRKSAKRGPAALLPHPRRLAGPSVR